MANITPEQVFPNIEYVAAGGTVAANSIVIPLSDLSGNLTVAEANPTTGDGRELMRQVIDTGLNNINNLASASKPTKMAISLPALTALSPTQIRKTYTASFDLDVVSSVLSIAAEA